MKIGRCTLVMACGIIVFFTKWVPNNGKLLDERIQIWLEGYAGWRSLLDP
jgi:hypothetical protein